MSSIWGPVLPVVKCFFHRKQNETRSGNPPNNVNIPKNHIRHLNLKASADSDDEINIGPTISVEDIVAQRLREAEAKREVFEIL